MKAVDGQWPLLFKVFLFVGAAIFFVLPHYVSALKINEYSDTLSDSGPSEQSNHALKFTLNTDVSPGSVFEITPPVGFTISASSSFGVRNVELRVNGSARAAAAVAAPGVDQVEITPGSPGFLRYTLAPDSGISSGSKLEFRIGNRTTNAIQPYETYSTSTGTTTVPGDIEPITNSDVLGRHDVKLEVYDGSLVASADFIIFLNEKVSVPNVDTTEEVPPFRFNGAPTSTVGGTTLSVEISLETDELAVCHYDIVPDTNYFLMPGVFTNTGLIFHSTVVSVVPDSVARYYIRCIDDEGNFNIDDYLIQFVVDPAPTGQSNTDGTTDGDGTGTGDNGSGSGGGGGGTSGSSDGEEPTAGGDTGTGGAGGGGGGGSGGGSGSSGGGGFENTTGPYRSGDGQVIITGYAFPQADVTILVDGQKFDTIKAGSSGSYSVTLDKIARGVYTFGIYAEGPDKVKSSTFSTSFTVTGARSSLLSNINIPPSISIKPDPVNPGEALTLSGYALPNANITLQNGKLNTTNMKTLSAVSNSSGAWSLPVDTSSFTKGTYQIRAKAEQTGGVATNYSVYKFYGVGQAAAIPINADLNRDGKVNLIDFSILLFWWNTAGGSSDPPADINRDGNVSLTDFSILLFNWTG